jgi:hypothetical protein
MDFREEEDYDAAAAQLDGSVSCTSRDREHELSLGTPPRDLLSGELMNRSDKEYTVVSWLLKCEFLLGAQRDFSLTNDDLRRHRARSLHAGRL